MGIILGYGFHISPLKRMLGYLEAHYQGTSDEYPQHTFLWRIGIISADSSITTPLEVCSFSDNRFGEHNCQAGNSSSFISQRGVCKWKNKKRDKFIAVRRSCESSFTNRLPKFYPRYILKCFTPLEWCIK